MTRIVEYLNFYKLVFVCFEIRCINTFKEDSNLLILLTKWSSHFIGHSNNIHCLAQAVNGIAGALFTICGHGDIEDRLKEFLAVSQFSLYD